MVGMHLVPIGDQCLCDTINSLYKNAVARLALLTVRATDTITLTKLSLTTAERNHSVSRLFRMIIIPSLTTMIVLVFHDVLGKVPAGVTSCNKA